MPILTAGVKHGCVGFGKNLQAWADTKVLGRKGKKETQKEKQEGKLTGADSDAGTAAFLIHRDGPIGNLQTKTLSRKK